MHIAFPSLIVRSHNLLCCIYVRLPPFLFFAVRHFSVVCPQRFAFLHSLSFEKRTTPKLFGKAVKFVPETTSEKTFSSHSASVWRWVEMCSSRSAAKRVAVWGQKNLMWALQCARPSCISIVFYNGLIPFNQTHLPDFINAFKLSWNPIFLKWL